MHKCTRLTKAVVFAFLLIPFFEAQTQAQNTMVRSFFLPNGEVQYDGWAIENGAACVLPLRQIPDEFFDAIARAQFNTLANQSSPMPCRGYSMPQVDREVPLSDLVSPAKSPEFQVPRLPEAYTLPGVDDLFNIRMVDGKPDTLMLEVPSHSMPQYQTWEAQPSVEQWVEFNGPAGVRITDVWAYNPETGLHIEVAMASTMQERFDGDGMALGHETLCFTSLPFPSTVSKRKPQPEHSTRFSVDYLFDDPQLNRMASEFVESPMSVEFTAVLKRLLQGVSSGEVKAHRLVDQDGQGELLTQEDLDQILHIEESYPTFDLMTGEMLGEQTSVRALSIDEVAGLRVDATWQVFADPFDIRKQVHGVVLLTRVGPWDLTPGMEAKEEPRWHPLIPVYFAIN